MKSFTIVLIKNFLQKHQQKTFHVSIKHKKMRTTTKLSYFFFFQKKRHIFFFQQKKIIFFFFTFRKKNKMVFLLTQFWGEFLQKQSSTREKKIRWFWFNQLYLWLNDQGETYDCWCSSKILNYKFEIIFNCKRFGWNSKTGFIKHKFSHNPDTKNTYLIKNISE
jgi:hypothetical protein